MQMAITVFLFRTEEDVLSGEASLGIATESLF